MITAIWDEIVETMTWFCDSVRGFLFGSPSEGRGTLLIHTRAMRIILCGLIGRKPHAQRVASIARWKRRVVVVVNTAYLQLPRRFLELSLSNNH